MWAVKACNSAQKSQQPCRTVCSKYHCSANTQPSCTLCLYCSYLRCQESLSATQVSQYSMGHLLYSVFSFKSVWKRMKARATSERRDEAQT